MNWRTERFWDWNKIQSNPCPGDSQPATILYLNSRGLPDLPSCLLTACFPVILPQCIPDPSTFFTPALCPLVSTEQMSSPQADAEGLCGPLPSLASPPTELCITPCGYMSQSCTFPDWGDNRVIVRIKLNNQYKMLRIEPGTSNCSINASTIIFIYFLLSC